MVPHGEKCQFCIYSRFFEIDDEADEVSVVLWSVTFPCYLDLVTRCAVGFKLQHIRVACVDRHYTVIKGTDPGVDMKTDSGELHEALSVSNKPNKLNLSKSISVCCQ